MQKPMADGDSEYGAGFESRKLAPKPSPGVCLPGNTVLCVCSGPLQCVYIPEMCGVSTFSVETRKGLNFLSSMTLDGRRPVRV